MKRYLFLALVVALFLLAVPAVVLADNGPHGSGYTNTTDACAGCHRAHTAVAASLLKQNENALCSTCHNGSGAQTNVTDGQWMGTPANRGLKSGGFVNAWMDTDANGTSALAAVTSWHTNDGSDATAWGAGAISASPNPGNTVQLACGSCHDPHGKAGTGGAATFRILKPNPKQSGAASVEIADETNKVYYVSSTTNDYFGQAYPTGVTVGDWCALCHDRYMNTGDADTSSGDSIFAYRHNTNHPDGTSPGPTYCLACHVAHGTSAAMGSNSQSVPWPGGGTGQTDTNRSSLLRVDSRGVCQRCHQK